MNDIQKKEITIPAIKNGTVIDHIPSIVTFKILKILDPKEFEHALSVAINLESKKLGKKGMIKIEDRYLSKERVNKIALLAPSATVSMIEDYTVKSKVRVRLPGMLVGLAKCKNPNCITNHESVNTIFYVKEKDPLKIVCNYCERIMERDDIELR